MAWGDIGASMARYRAASPLDEETALILFGVGLETLQRIERGEVDPEPELAEKIGHVIGLAPHSSTFPGAPAKAGVSPERASSGAQGDGREATACPSPFGFSLVRSGEGHVVLIWNGERSSRLSLAEARAMRADLGRLLDLHADPALYEKD